jgi:hypothetical protein
MTAAMEGLVVACPETAQARVDSGAGRSAGCGVPATIEREHRPWDAEIDWAIAYRFTVLRNPPADNQLKPRSKELSIDQPTKEHLRRYKQWKKTGRTGAVICTKPCHPYAEIHLNEVTGWVWRTR